MHGLAYGLATRARRPRPSEKITSRVVSGPSPLGVPRWAWPRRGGAGSARPGGWAWAPHRDLLILAATTDATPGGCDISCRAYFPPFQRRFLRASEKTTTCVILWLASARTSSFCAPGNCCPSQMVGRRPWDSRLRTPSRQPIA